MSINATRMDEISTIILEAVPPSKFPDDPIANLEEAKKFKEHIGGHIYRLIDLSAVSADYTFSDVMIGMATERGKEGGADDPDVTTIFVGFGDVVELGAKSLQEQEQYGKGDVHLFNSQDEALRYIREREGK